MKIDEAINGWTFEETVKTAERLMEAEKNIFKWDVIRHLRDFAENYRVQLKEYQQSEEQSRLIKFYYCESLNEYYVGKRCDNFYYAKVEIQSNGDICLCYKWSRYLPWGKSVVDELSSWKEYTYPSEPKEISFEEWLKGWLSEEKLKELRGDV